MKLGFVQQALEVLEDTESQLTSAKKRSMKKDLHADASTITELLEQAQTLQQRARRERIALGTANIRSEPITVAQIPPKMTPMPCKPLLFDLAANDVDYRAGTGGSGLRGWIGGWLGKK